MDRPHSIFLYGRPACSGCQRLAGILRAAGVAFTERPADRLTGPCPDAVDGADIEAHVQLAMQDGALPVLVIVPKKEATP